jgi:prepilin-type N-terminal cleavage/methylation domain-containing protein
MVMIMSKRPSRLRRTISDLPSERGLTLVEMVIVVSVLGVVLAFATKSFISLQAAATGDRLRLQNLEQARFLIDVVSKDIRTATRLSSSTSPFDVGATSLGLPAAPAPGAGNGTAPPYVSGTEVWFYGNLNLNTTNPDPCPSIVHLYLDTTASPTVLKEQVLAAAAGGTPPSCTYTGSYTTRTEATYVTNTSALPIFTYYYSDGSGNPAAFSIAQTPLSAANGLLVNAVGLSLSVKEGTNPTVPATTLINRARLPNVYFNPAEA